MHLGLNKCSHKTVGFITHYTIICVKTSFKVVQRPGRCQSEGCAKAENASSACQSLNLVHVCNSHTKLELNHNSYQNFLRKYNSHSVPFETADLVLENRSRP